MKTTLWAHIPLISLSLSVLEYPNTSLMPRGYLQKCDRLSSPQQPAISMQVDSSQRESGTSQTLRVVQCILSKDGVER